jgi:hypothetical protein
MTFNGPPAPCLTAGQASGFFARSTSGSPEGASELLLLPPSSRRGAETCTTVAVGSVSVGHAVGKRDVADVQRVARSSAPSRRRRCGRGCGRVGRDLELARDLLEEAALVAHAVGRADERRAGTRTVTFSPATSSWKSMCTSDRLTGWRWISRMRARTVEPPSDSSNTLDADTRSSVSASARASSDSDCGSRCGRR